MSNYISNARQFLNNIGEKLSEERLIGFDYRVLLLVLASVIIFTTLVLFKIHGASIACWNNIVSNEAQPNPRLEHKRTGLLLGSPRGIRADEWSVQTPFILSQLNREPKFPVENEVIGAGKAPLINQVPAKHFSNIFRPQNWGFFALGAERGFSFYWNFKIFALVLGFFFLLMLITNNNFWLSIFGSLWLFFSMYIQWWFSTSLPELIGAFSTMFAASAYLLLSSKKSSIVISSIMLVISGVGFVLILYPPFQIQLLYLWLFLLAGFMLVKFDSAVFKENIGFRLGLIFMTVSVSVLALYLFYQETKSTIDIIANTVYPGLRRCSSGDRSLLRVFSGYYDIFMGRNTVPKTESNICEASNFILLSPLVLVGIILEASRSKKPRIDMLQTSIFTYLFLLIAWMTLKNIPEAFGQFTLFDRVPVGRAYLGLGIASIIASVRYLSDNDNHAMGKKLNLILMPAIFASLLLYGMAFKIEVLGFYTIRHVIFISIFMTLIAYLFLNKKRLYFSVLFLIFVLIPTFSINPISTGLGPIYDKDLTRLAMDIKKEDPSGKWVVFGERLFGNFLEASGANVFNGVKYVPDLELFKVLDPKREHVDAYNRYAHIGVLEPDPKSNKDIDFEAGGDSYVIKVSPRSEKLRQLGIRYFVFTYKPDPKVVAGMSPVTHNPVGNAWVYKAE